MYNLLAASMGNPLSAKNWASLDADTILTSGFYLNMATMTNVPNSYGTIIVFAHSIGVHVVQIYIEASSYNRVYIRQRSSGSWSEWVKLATTDV